MCGGGERQMHDTHVDAQLLLGIAYPEPGRRQRKPFQRSAGRWNTRKIIRQGSLE